MIIVLGNIIIITTILIITTVTIINEAMRIHSQPSLQFEDLEQRLKKEDGQFKNGVKNLVLYYSNLDYETVFNTLNTKMVDRDDFVFCAGYCYY